MDNHVRSTREMREERLAKDPAFREEWDRTTLARTVARVLIAYRIEHSLSQTRLADKLGMRQPQVARLELGEHTPSWETLHRIFLALGLSFDYRFLPPSADLDESESWPPKGTKVHEEITTSTGARVLVALH